jgi:hypothetical protein
MSHRKLLRISRMTTATTRGNQRDYRSDQGPGATLVGFRLRSRGCRTHASGRRGASTRADQVRLAQPGGWQGSREGPKQPSDLTDHQEAPGKAAVRRHRPLLRRIRMVRPRQKSCPLNLEEFAMSVGFGPASGGGDGDESTGRYGENLSIGHFQGGAQIPGGSINRLRGAGGRRDRLLTTDDPVPAAWCVAMLIAVCPESTNNKSIRMR